MKILHILNDIHKLGNGIINVAVDLACLQSKAGHRVAIASAGGEYESLLAKYGVTHFHLDQRRRPINLIKAARRYQAIVQGFQPDIVHAHMMTGMVLAWLFRRSQYHLVATVHNEFQPSAILMGLADRVIAVSHAVNQSMQQRGIPAQKLRVVQNGPLGSPRQETMGDPMPLQRPAIATVAGMYQRKGIADLITAFELIANICPTAHLYLIGDGPDRAKFAAQAQSSAVGDRIHFEGFQAEPQRYLQSTDVFVLASHREPFGLVLAEARAMGCAIVATQVDGIPEVLEGGKAGILVLPADPSALARAIAHLLHHPNQIPNGFEPVGALDVDPLNTWKQRAHQNLLWLSATRVQEETLTVYAEFSKLRHRLNAPPLPLLEVINVTTPAHTISPQPLQRDRPESSQTHHFAGFDFLRAFFAIMVVVLHAKLFVVLTGRLQLGNLANVLNANVGYLAVPVFLQISLFLFLLKRQQSGSQYFWQKRLPKLVLLYLVWSIAKLIFDTVLTGKSEALKQGTASLGKTIGFLIGGGYSAFYFFFSLLFLTAIAEVLISGCRSNRRIRSQRVLYRFLMITCLCVFLFPFIDATISDSEVFTQIVNPLNFLPYVFTTAITVCELREGMFQRLTTSLKFKLYGLLALFLVFTILEWVWIERFPQYARLSLVFGSWLLLYLALLSTQKPPAAVVFLAQCSLGIYVFHVFFIDHTQFLDLLSDVIPGTGPLSRFLITLIGSITLTLLFQRHRMLKQLV